MQVNSECLRVCNTGCQSSLVQSSFQVFIGKVLVDRFNGPARVSIVLYRMIMNIEFVLSKTHSNKLYFRKTESSLNIQIKQTH